MKLTDSMREHMKAHDAGVRRAGIKIGNMLRYLRDRGMDVETYDGIIDVKLSVQDLMFLSNAVEEHLEHSRMKQIPAWEEGLNFNYKPFEE